MKNVLYLGLLLCWPNLVGDQRARGFPTSEERGRGGYASPSPPPAPTERGQERIKEDWHGETGTSQGMPFGINNAYASSKETTDIYLKDLGVEWISDHFPRRDIEKVKKNKTSYDFSEVDRKLTEYAREARTRAWLIVNLESRHQFEDGQAVVGGKKSGGKYIPSGPASYRAYGDFLRELVTHVNSAVPGWRAEYWSIDNEQGSLYIPAYCPGDVVGPECGRKAAEAYAEAVIFSARVIHGVDPMAKIVFGGPGGGTPDEEYEYFYKPALKALAARQSAGGFDFFDYHNFDVYQGYATNSRGNGLEFFQNMLSDSGLHGKPIIIKAGATHSGRDDVADNKRLHEPQTESEQAEHLIKRFVYHVANGVSLILWGDIREDTDVHGTFSHNGLVYNGIPQRGECNPQDESPCPDPGDGVKKLSYYALKHLIEKLNGLDFARIQTLSAGKDSVHIHEFVGAQNRAVWVAWWDYWIGASTAKNIVLDVGDAASVLVTDALPRETEGAQITPAQYKNSFAQRSVPASAGKATITLGKSPVFVEIPE